MYTGKVDNAYTHGWDCYTRVLDRNPFHIITTDYDEWRDGWKAAQLSEVARELRAGVVSLFLSVSSNKA